ncbi:LPD38 domain-containing protein [Prevotella nigrescens]|uniref:LPD38 domain-containing protein n=1 Tax=Prevotella nigrescens TaxID=28133 RepID=UPI00242CD456|nr:LPD38 domain-containing protein [Prevotella nigrescens]
MEISVSSHFVNPNKMLNKLMEFNREYTKETLFSNSSEMRLAEHQSDVPDLLPTQENNVSSIGKDTQSSQTKQEKEDKFVAAPRKEGESILDFAERVAAEHQSYQERKEEEAKVDTNPTDAQKEAGNYKKGHIKVDGLDITIEQPKGSIRRGTDANGKQWESEMHNTYGYIRGTESVDGDHIDIFLSDNPTEGNVFVVDQINKDGSFDEHKVMYGFPDMESAKRAYLSNYEEGWQGLGSITEVKKEDFKKWIDSSKRKTKPFAEYSTVKTQGDVQTKKPTEAELRERKKQELKNKLKAKLRGQLNVGVDPELFMIGVELASMEIEDGARKFIDFAKKMISEIGNEIRPYLKSIYNGARDLPGMESLSEEMTPYDEVKAFNIATIGKETEDIKPSVFDTAEQISNEQAVELSAKEEAKNTVETEDVDNDVYSITKQHNNKKDIDIWVVRGKKRTDKGVYMQRKQAAREHNGYYSSFRGVNGFVFDTPEDAQSFADKVFDAKDEQINTETNENYAHNSNEIMHEDSNAANLLTDSHNEQEQSGKEAELHGLKIGDKVLYKGKEATIFDFDNGRPVLDTGLAPVVYDVVDMDAVKPIEKQEQTKTNVKEDLTEEKTEAKAEETNNKTLSSHVEGNLFDAAPTESLTNKDKDDEVHVRNGGSTAKREQGHESRQNEPLGESKQNEAQRPDGQRMGGRDTAHSRTDAERSGRLSDISKSKQRLNTTNNHGERGVDYAPTSVDARIEANIQAIELANELIENGEKATPQQMAVLRKFSGWGGLGKAFNETVNGYYGEVNKTPRKLKELLGEEAYNNAIESANSSYYTPAHVIDTLWDIAEKLGFKGGNILEGSAGIGNIIGQIPTHLSENSNIHAVEKDPTAGGMLSLLYPEAKVDIQGFEETYIPNGSIDLAITNVPFVTGLRVWDTTSDKDLSKKFHDIHNFCIAKNVRKLREGGIGIFISSNGTLDNSQKLCDWVVSEGNADFIGAFRLNNKTFLGTSVTSDIIVIRKRVNGKKSANAIDVSTVTGERTAEFNTGEVKNVKGEMIPVIKDLSMDYNKYFVEHPENMAGEMDFAFEHGETYRATTKGLYPVQDKPQDKLLKDFVNSFAAKQEQAVADNEKTDNAVYKTLGSDVKEGSMVVSNGELCIAQYGQAVPLGLNANKVKGHTKQECFNAYTEIKQALDDVLTYETENTNDKGLQPLLDKLNKVYDDFVNTYGHFHKNTAISFLRKDVDYPNVLSLENYKEENDAKNKRVRIFSKTDVFSKRVVTKETEPKPDNVKDGVIVSIYKNGRIDIPYISKQLNMSEDAVKDEIINSGLGFEDPVSKEIEVSYKYLSGNVREKLQQAEDNNENGAYNNNIKALKEVIPANIPAHLIEFNLGSSWVTPKIYEDYTKEKTGIEVKFVSVGGTWFMKAPEYGLGIEQNRSMGVHSTIVQKTILGHELIEAAIQNKTITVSKTQKNWDGKTETIIDKEATQACGARIDEIRQEFKDWARGKMQSDVELNTEIERTYNETFNNYVPIDIPSDFIPKHFGGSTHNITLRPHQAKAVVRGTMQPLMLAHEVGTGKTFTLISTAMEMRRLGTARKPMIVVQNATVGQFVASAKALYPNAKILTLENADHGAEGRKRFYAKIRYNDWDMIVVPQSTFEFIPDSEERQIAFIKDKVEEKMIVLEKMREADESGQSFMTRRAEKELEQLQEELATLTDNAAQKRNEKQLTAKELKKKEVSKQNAEVKAREMLDRRTDDVENFDDMGIDALLVDEAHEYKHLGFATAMQRGVKGVDPSYSKKSQGVFLKTQAVLSKNHGRNVIFATGTPISNTAAEIWTFMRYLMPSDTMKEYGIYYFDDFVRNFGSIQQMLEFTTSGKFKENNRFAGYIDLPELARIWSSVSDIVLTEEQEELKEKIPEIEGGKAQDIYLPQTKALRSVMKYVKKQLTDYDNMSGKEKKENSHIPLTMYGIAKAAAVDARLVDATAEDDVNNKTNEAVRQTLSALKETASYKGTVAIFADIYQNKASGFNLYEDIRKKLIEQGVPEKEIFIMKPGMTINKKLEIFDKVNSGEIRVVMGSTFTLGTGVNIQERLHTLIHVDAPNRPMDYTQRNGRILRQGNIHKDMNKPVRILRFGVEDSLDVTAYQRLKTKGAIADSIMNSKQLMANSMENRAIEEEEDVFGDTVAQLSGSEYAMLKNQAEKAVRKFESKKRQWEADQTYIHNAKPRLRGQIFDAERMLADNSAHLETVTKTFPNGEFKKITIGKMQFDSVDAMSDFIKDFNKKIREESDKIKDSANSNYNSKLVVNIDGLDFVVHTEMTKETISKGINIFSKTTRKMYYSQEELGLKNVPIKQGLLRNGIEDIVLNVITGHDFAERIDTLNQNIARYKSDLELILTRDGKPFEFEKELENAKEKYEEYTEAMKKELEEKEKKYAELDSKVEEAGNLSKATEAEEDENEKDTDSDVLFRRGNVLNSSIDIDEITQHAKAVASVLHLDNIEVVADDSIFEDKKATAKGFYNKKTGKITIIASNHTDIADIEKTVLHEAVAHYGLRQLFGNDFDKFLDTVFAKSDIETRRQIAHLSAKHGWNVRTATEEYLASMAEDTNFEQIKPTLWQRIKQLFGEIMNAFGLHHAKLTDNDLRYMLWRSYKNLQGGGKRSILDMAEDIATQYRLKVGNHADKFTNELNAVNERFNEELSNLTEDNADKVALWLGKPSKVLLAAGVEDKPMKLYGNKVIRKMKKHGFSLEELRNLPRAVADPIAVFDNIGREGNRSVLTELHTENGNFLVAIDLGKGKEDIDFNIISSVFGKGDNKVVDWINKGFATYINKEKALNYLHHSAPIAEALSNSRLSSAAKIIKDFHNPKLNSNVLYRSSIDPTATEVLPDARTRYEEETKEPDKIGSVPKTHNFFRRFYKSYVDSMLALKSFTNSVLEATGDKMASHEDTYKAENAMTSKNKTDGEVYNRDYYNPLLTAAQQLCEAVGMDYDALNMYMVAKHGLERNEYMGKRAAQNEENVLKAKKSLEDALAAYNEDPTSENETAVQKAQEKYSKVYDKALEVHTSRDYSGLTELTGKEDVAEAEYEAQKIVDAVETPDAMPKVTAFWSKVNAATKQTLKTGYESGIMTKDTYEHILNMYKYYIPLRGWAKPTADDVYTYYNNRSYEGKPLTKTAKGRTSLAEDPMAIIASMAQRSIIEANRNKMKQTFLNFVLNHPTSLATVGEQWYIKNALGEWERSDANIPTDATPDEISKIIEEHELKMQELAEQGAAIKQRNGLKLDKRVINGEGAEHTIKVWRGGKEYIIYINGNPAVAQAVNGLTNPDTQGSDLPKWAKIGAAQLKNFLSGVYTSFSPAFVLTNFTRDQLFASQAVYIKYGLKYKRQASKNARNLFFSGALPRLVYKWEHGTLDMNDETERYFDEFMRGGGETGFTALRDIESIKKEVEDAINGNKANIAKRGWKSFINAVEFANRSAEDFSRFVTFMTSRQQGKNIVDAIYDAKDITVNFNKKGSGEMGSRFMNFAYIFFNAAVQSINNFGTMLKQHPARTMLVISKFGALGFGVPMLNAFLTGLCGGGDDDKYWDNMDWVRRNNIVLRLPFLEKTFISIPLPQELRPFYGMGEIAASILFGKETFSSGLQKAVEGFTGLLPIDFTGNGGNLPITLTPTVLQPVAQYMFNTDYFGRKVYNDNEKKKFAPGWTKAFSSTPPVLIEATKFLNSLTGGNDVDRGAVSLNPDVINHFVKGYFGGPATFVTQMSSLLYKGFSGNAKEIHWRDVPVASRFVQQLDERSVRSSAQGSYKDFKEETEETEYRLSNYKKQVKMGKMEYAKMITDLIKSPEYQRYKIAKAYKKPMDLLQETLNHIDNTTDKKEVEKALTGLRHYMMETVESEQKGKHAKREEDFNYLGDSLSELNNNLKYSLRSLKRNEEQRLDGEEDDGIEELISEDKETIMRIIREMNKLFKKK